MMKTVLFINFNTSSGRLEKVVKQIPYAPEDKSIYYIDISQAEKSLLGVKELYYMNNQYEDDLPVVWIDQPSHVASCYIPEEYLEKMLLMAMFRQFNQMCDDFKKQITTCNDIHRTMLYFPRKDGTYPGDKHTTVVHQFTLFGTPHLFIGQNGGFTHEELLKIQRSVIADKRNDLQKALLMLSLICDLISARLGELNFDFPDEE